MVFYHSTPQKETLWTANTPHPTSNNTITTQWNIGLQLQLPDTDMASAGMTTSANLEHLGMWPLCEPIAMEARDEVGVDDEPKFAVNEDGVI